MNLTIEERSTSVTTAIDCHCQKHDSISVATEEIQKAFAFQKATGRLAKNSAIKWSDRKSRNIGTETNYLTRTAEGTNQLGGSIVIGEIILKGCTPSHNFNPNPTCQE